MPDIHDVVDGDHGPGRLGKPEVPEKHCEMSKTEQGHWITVTSLLFDRYWNLRFHLLFTPHSFKLLEIICLNVKQNSGRR